ncbi:hypothetical protein Moror_13731 [Moniliophthora roreri MCA 2997]|uniref:Uncharacterized protein n=1 Tax=Moniliophthora roreri (strain MCA 2997) TaxID=1381753 RepID=V2WU27_MONRO|nr:hypothetical protein Moror_13731 [Moniliophthora roreri MCA 2997]
MSQIIDDMKATAEFITLAHQFIGFGPKHRDFQTSASGWLRVVTSHLPAQYHNMKEFVDGHINLPRWKPSMIKGKTPGIYWGPRYSRLRLSDVGQESPEPGQTQGELPVARNTTE